MSKPTSKFSPEVRERAVRMVLDGAGPHGSRWQAVVSISAKIGCAPQTLNDRVKRAEVDSGRRAGVSTDMAAGLKALERDNRELRQAEEVLRRANGYFALAEFDRRSKRWCRSSMRIGGMHWVEQICSVLLIALPPATAIWRSGPTRRGSPTGRAGLGQRAT